MKGNITRRNILGGFLGGLLGILACGYLEPFVLPLGCLFGVVLGWWYRETMSLTYAWALWIKRLELPRFPQFQPLFKHPVNRAYAVRFLTTTVYLAVNALWVVSTLSYMERMDEAGIKSAGSFFFGLCWMTAVLAILVAPFAFMTASKETDRVRKFYKAWERYANGSTRFFFVELYSLFITEAVMFFVVNAVGMLVIAIPTIIITVFVVGEMIGLVAFLTYKAVVDINACWMCLCTTLATTVLIALTAYPYFGDVRLLWSAAVFSGVTSAIVTEGLRRVLNFFLTGEVVENRIRNFPVICIDSCENVFNMGINWGRKLIELPVPE